MDTTKKKIKKGFAVPAAKPNTEDSKETDKPKKTLGINRNNNKGDSASETNIEKQKKEETRSSTVETNTLKPKTVETITKAQQSEKKKEKPKKHTEEMKKVQRSLSVDEYDEIFMSVLASVMKAEREGDVKVQEEQAPATNGEKEEEGEAVTQVAEAGESEEDARSEVIQVTVKVESVEGSDHFIQVDAEHDIDNWDGEEKIHEAATAKVISPIRKENVKTLTPRQDKNSSIFKNKKQEKKKEPLKVKEKQAAKSEVNPKKKKFVVSNEDKDKKVKKKRKESKAESGSEEQAVKSKDKLSLKKVMQERELEDLGTWVQCGIPDCLKWRYLRNITDPMDIPQRWECSMNIDEQFNSCEKEEEDYDEDEHIYTKYTEGSIVLAKMAGYPWWPGMIEIDPDYDTYFEVAVPASMYPTKYHVVFFDKNVSRAWISLSGIKPFSEIEALPRKAKGHDYSKEVNAAVKNAKDAMDLPIKERLKKFSFASRFSGKWGRVGDQMTAKPKKQKKRGPKRQKFDDDVMVDDKTLDQILNNSQSVLSDVAEMLSSIDTATFDSDTDPEFDIGAPKQRKRKTPTVKSEKEQATLNAMVYQEDEEEDQEAPVKFEPGQLDRDVFTMEMDTEPMETSDLEQTVNNLNLSQVIDETEEDAENMNVQYEEDVRKKNEDEESRKKKENKEDKTIDKSSKPKKKSMKTKTGVDKSLGKGDEVEKKKKIKTDRPANESEDKKCTFEKKKKRKNKKTDENDNNVSVEKEDSNVKDKVEKKKKKIKKSDKDLSEKTADSTENLSEIDNAVDKKNRKKNLDDENDVSEKKDTEKKEGKEQDNVEKKKKKSKKNCDGEIDVSEKRQKNDDDTTDNREVESNNKSKGKKMKMVSEERGNDDKKETAIESKETFEKKNNKNNTESTKQEKESKLVKAKKPKTKFSNPVVKTATKDDKCSQGDKSSQKEHPKGEDKAEEIAKKPDSQMKSKAHIENNESDEELNFDNSTIPVDGAESEDDFILDLMEPAQSKVQPAAAAAAAANDGEDSEPLDFEE